jgi:predicted  nucleic acid-binding Zn-ribbon protein
MIEEKREELKLLEKELDYLKDEYSDLEWKIDRTEKEIEYLYKEISLERIKQQVLK